MNFIIIIISLEFYNYFCYCYTRLPVKDAPNQMDTIDQTKEP